MTWGWGIHVHVHTCVVCLVHFPFYPHYLRRWVHLSVRIIAASISVGVAKVMIYMYNFDVHVTCIHCLYSACCVTARVTWQRLSLTPGASRSSLAADINFSRPGPPRAVSDWPLTASVATWRHNITLLWRALPRYCFHRSNLKFKWHVQRGFVCFR